MAVVTTNLGVVTAYGDAVAAGYTGTKEEWQALMANYATVGEQASRDAQTASTAAQNASTAAQTATTKASEASTSAQTAKDYAEAIGTPDTTLTVTGKAADAKATGDAVSELKSGLNEITITEEAIPNNLLNPANVNSGYYWTDGHHDSTSYDNTGYISVEEGKTYYLWSTANTGVFRSVYIRFATAYDEGKNLVDWAADITSYTVPVGAKYIIFSAVPAYLVNSSMVTTLTGSFPYEPYFEPYKEITIRMDKVDAYTKEEIDDRFGSVPVVATQIPITGTLGYFSNTGSAGSNTTLAYTQKISVQEGDVLRFIPRYSSKAVTIRMLCAYNGETVVSGSGISSSVKEYEVPSGIDGVVITGFVGTNGDASTLPYLYRWRPGEVLEKSNRGAWSVDGNLSNGGRLLIPSNNINKNKVLTFFGTIGTFSALKFGRTAYQNAIRIDNTNIELIDASGLTVSATAHGLTIANNIAVRIEHNLVIHPYQVKVTVSSNGVIADTITLSWAVYNNGQPYVESDGSTLTDCALSYAPKDINKVIWAFGDSYFSYENNRWMGQLRNAGYADNVLTNAYPGESAAQNIPSLENLLDIGKPNYLIWCSGMNDASDSGSEPNSIWSNPIQLVLTECESRGIIPILSTIPTVPSINHENKNAWVRSSGYRYIDFAKAVGADANGNWYTGMLSSDNVHPTEKGAIALFNRAIADCPELMQTS